MHRWQSDSEMPNGNIIWFAEEFINDKVEYQNKMGIKDEWNSLAYHHTFIIKKGAWIVRSIAAPQGDKVGGGKQVLFFRNDDLNKEKLVYVQTSGL